MSNLTKLLHKVFDGWPTVHNEKSGRRNAVLPLTDFHPANHGADLALLASGLAALVPNWDDVSAIVGVADRNAGTLVHQVSVETRVPYTLANWYPAGSKGDIVVEKSGGFTGGDGVVLLNGLHAGDKVVYIDDMIRSGDNAYAVIESMKKARVQVLHALFVADVADRTGMKRIEKKLGVKCSSLATVDVTKDKSKVTTIQKLARPIAKPQPVLDVAAIKSLPAATIRKKFENVMASFVGVPIYYAKNSTYPYCNFCLTDFVPLMTPQLVEDMADCMVYLGDFGPSSPTQLIVSESDRGGGPLAVAISLRTGLPLTMANWSESAHQVGVVADAKVGYSGQGSLYLNGVTKGTHCTIVDDMLSSGGTCEGLINAVVAAGATVHEAIFASEKVNTGGRKRLGPQWPKLKLTSLCYFIADGKATKAHAPLPGSNSTPLQRCPSSPKATTKAAGSSPRAAKKQPAALAKSAAKSKAVATSKKAANSSKKQAPASSKSKSKSAVKPKAPAKKKAGKKLVSKAVKKATKRSSPVVKKKAAAKAGKK